MASSACAAYHQWLPSSVQLQPHAGQYHVIALLCGKPQGNNLLLPCSGVTTEHYGIYCPVGAFDSMASRATKLLNDHAQGKVYSIVS